MIAIATYSVLLAEGKKGVVIGCGVFENRLDRDWLDKNGKQCSKGH